MRKVWRFLGIGGVGLGSMALIAFAVLYAGSQRLINRVYEVPLSAFVATDDPALVAEGERLARIRGCIGCHGAALEGRVFIDEPLLARIVAPDLTLMAREHSDAELERVIRRGVRRDGRSVWVMPSPMYYHLSDEDLGAIIAYIRSVAPSSGPPTEVRLRVLGRLGLVSGQFPPLVDEIDQTASRFTPDREDALSFGRYLALTVCTECHGADLRGAQDGGAPSLGIAAAFSSEAFARLMREGIGLGDRELGMMGGVARDRFAHFTDGEIDALHTYLRTLTEQEAMRP
jgi:mono/diheme cytochrome c family protein